MSCAKNRRRPNTRHRDRRGAAPTQKPQRQRLGQTLLVPLSCASCRCRWVSITHSQHPEPHPPYEGAAAPSAGQGPHGVSRPPGGRVDPPPQPHRPQWAPARPSPMAADTLRAAANDTVRSRQYRPPVCRRVVTAAKHVVRRRAPPTVTDLSGVTRAPQPASATSPQPLAQTPRGRRGLPRPPPPAPRRSHAAVPQAAAVTGPPPPRGGPPVPPQQERPPARWSLPGCRGGPARSLSPRPPSPGAAHSESHASTAGGVAVIAARAARPARGAPACGWPSPPADAGG